VNTACITGAILIAMPPVHPDRRRRDADNLPKAILDLLTANRVIEDDARVVKVTAAARACTRPSTPRTSSSLM